MCNLLWLLFFIETLQAYKLSSSFSVYEMYRSGRVGIWEINIVAVHHQGWCPNAETFTMSEPFIGNVSLLL